MSGETTVGLAGTIPDEARDALAGDATVVEADDPTDPTSILEEDVDVVIAAGESALGAVARAAPQVPVVPVEAGRGVRSIPADDLAAAVPAILEVHHETEGHETEGHTPLAVAVDGETVGRALFDVSLVAAEVAHISAFHVADGGEPVGDFRADGVVVATPAGSTGYANRIGLPVLSPAVDAVGVAPIGPFATDPDDWVLPPGALELVVARDRVAVDVLADDRTVATVDPGEVVTVTPLDPVAVAVLPQSQSRYR